jgi:uncharacterized membrane protein
VPGLTPEADSVMLRQWLAAITDQAVPAIDLLALIIIVAGTLQAFIAAITAIFSGDERVHAGREMWMRYSRWLVAGLTFQLAADIIETSVAPTWDDIGQLGAVAVIRTFLDFFLARDQREVRALEKVARVRKAP